MAELRHAPQPCSRSSSSGSGGGSGGSSRKPPAPNPSPPAPQQLQPPSHHHHHQEAPQQQQQQQQQQQHQLLLLHHSHNVGFPVSKAALGTPQQQPPPQPQPHRDDCWSDGATLALIHSWGLRYLELNRGNLKQQHWKDVADCVNRGSQAPKTDGQCKNRLDTLKKKYKLEKSRIATGAAPSKWAFFDCLDELIGPSKKPKKPAPVRVRASPVAAGKRPLDEVEEKPFCDTATAPSNLLVGTADTISKSKDSPDMTDSCPDGPNNTPDGKGCKRKRPLDSPFKDLAKAILKFGEIYERIETSKQQQMMDLEKQRMEFTKDLELQRLQLFMQTQLELAKMKHSKHGSTEHFL